jgi:hypothetical protein
MASNNNLLHSENDFLEVDPTRYAGVAPINVDNVNDVISFDKSTLVTLTQGNNITLVETEYENYPTNYQISSKDWTSDISNAVSGKLDTSTFNTYVNNHANDDVTPYTGGTGISVNNHQISCNGDITPYTAGSNINISNHVVSGKDWSSDISTTVNNALTGYQAKLTGITDVQVVSALPSIPLANVLYLVKE